MIKVSNVINKTIKCEQRGGDIQSNLESQSKSKSSMIILGEPARIRAIRTKISKTLQYSCHVLIYNYPKEWTYHQVQYDIYGCPCGDIMCTLQITVPLAYPSMR